MEEIKKRTPKKDITPKPLTVKIELSEMEKDNKQIAKGRRTSYVVKVAEQGHVHVELEKVSMNRTTFEKQSVPYVQIFDVRAWNNFRKQAKKLGFVHVRVLHAPPKTNIEVIDPMTAETKKK